MCALLSVGHGSLLTDIYDDPDTAYQLMDQTRPDPRPTENAYLHIISAPVTGCLNIKHFIHKCLICTENNEEL